MKKLLKFLPILLLGLFATVSLASCSDDDGEHIAETQLPKAANDFLNIYYPQVKIAKVVRDKENGVQEYVVTLSNVHKVIFDTTGDWMEVDAPAGQIVPRGFYPQAINVYLVENAKYGTWEIINSISKESYGYEVELTNGDELHFDASGKFIAQDPD